MRLTMAQRIVVIGGGAAGIGAAGAAKGTDRSADVRVYTEFEDVGYSPCGIPYVHGREIPDFERLFLATRETYDNAGIEIHYETRVTGFSPGKKTVTVAGEGEVGYDKLIVATGFDYADPGVPGTDLANLYYVKNIRRAIEWDKVLDGVKSAVVVEASPLGLEMVTALCHRGIETHLVDPGAWALSVATDPDIIAPVQNSWQEKGAKLHFNTTLTGFAGGVIVDERMHTSAADVWAAGDCTEIPHSVTQIPIQGLSGSHAYSQGKVAGTNAAGGERRYQPVSVPWGMM